MIDRAVIDRILSTANIVEVVSDFVTLRKRGVNYIGLCPFHNEKTPSFSVSPSKQFCKCFSCGEGGNAVHFLMKLQGITYVEAIKRLGQKYGIEVVDEEQTDEQRQASSLRESLYVVNEHARDYFQHTLFHDPEGQAVGMAYFRQRGFRDDIIRKFQLGFCTKSWDAFAREAQAKGYKREYLLKTGLCYERDDRSLVDRFHGRVIFPVHALSGKVVAFGGRILSSDKKQAKYVNSPESEIYSKSNELYGIYLGRNAIRKAEKCFLVEGYTDVISMHQAGVENVVASSGTALTTGQIRMIHRITENITVIYDGDAAGIHASLRGIDMLLEEGMNIKVLLLPDGDDPDSFSRKHTATEFQEYIKAHETDFIRFKTGLLLEEAGSDPLKRAALIKDIVRSIAVIPEGIVRSVYIRECSQLMQVEENLLLTEVNRAIRTRKEERRKQEEIRQRQEEFQRRRESLAPAVQDPSAAVALPVVSGSEGPVPPPPAFPDAPLPPTVADAAVPVPPPSFVSGEVPPPVPESPAEGVPEILAPPVADVGTMGMASVSSGGLSQKLLQKKVPGSEQELLLMRLLVRYGERIVYEAEAEDGTAPVPVTVAEFISSSLEEDKMPFHNPLHMQMLSEALAGIKDPSFGSERYFIQHPDPQISALAVDLATDRDVLSRLYTEAGAEDISEASRLYELAPRLVVDYKNALISAELKQLIRSLQHIEKGGDASVLEETLHRIKELQDIRNCMERHLGERVVLRGGDKGM